MAHPKGHQATIALENLAQSLDVGLGSTPWGKRWPFRGRRGGLCVVSLIVTVGGTGALGLLLKRRKHAIGHSRPKRDQARPKRRQRAGRP